MFEDENGVIECRSDYISGYDFPKFKFPTPDTFNLVLTDGTNDYPAAIIKQEDGSYVLNASLSNYNTFYGPKAIAIQLKSIETTTETLLLLNVINIFWNVVSSDDWIVNNGDISIEGISEPLQFEFLQGGLFITKTDLSDFEQKPYNITLTIKNRQYHPFFPPWRRHCAEPVLFFQTVFQKKNHSETPVGDKGNSAGNLAEGN